jgi:MFS family permease
VQIDPHGNWRAFRHRNFRILFASNAVSNIGSWAQRIAQDWLVLELTHSGTYLGIVTGLQFAPVLFFSLHGGALGDRFDKQKVLVATNLVGGAASGFLGLLVISHHIQIWHIFILAFILGVSSAVDAPVRMAFSAEVVGKDDVANAVSLNSANFNSGRIIGPALSGLSIAAFGTGPSFILNALSYAIIIFGILKLRKSEFFPMPHSVGSANVREGMKYVSARPDLYAIMIVVFFTATFGLNFQIFNAMMATKVFHRGAASFGLLGTALAVGALAGALLSTRIEGHRKTVFVIYGSITFDISLIVLAFMPSYLLYALWLPVCGVTALTTMIAANSLMQVNSDPVVRGRVMGIYLFVFMGGTPFISPLVGVMSEQFGVRLTIITGGIVPVLASVIVLLKYRNRVEVPQDFSIDVVLPSTYDNKG